MFRKSYIKSNLDTIYFNKWNTARNIATLTVIGTLWRRVILKFYRAKIGLPCETNEKTHRISRGTSDQNLEFRAFTQKQKTSTIQRWQAGFPLSSCTKLPKRLLYSFTMQVMQVQLPPLPDRIWFTILTLSISSGWVTGCYQKPQKEQYQQIDQKASVQTRESVFLSCGPSHWAAG